MTEVRRDLGVFVDTGIPNKEIVVSLDVLPEMKELWPKKGDKLYIRLEVDKKDRIWGIPAEPEVFQKWPVLHTIICKINIGQQLFTA